jgi:acetyl esterase/lipase
MASSFQRFMAQSFKYLPGGLMNKLAGDAIVMDGRTLDPLLQVFWKQGQEQAVEQFNVETSRAGVKIGAKLLAAPHRPMKSIKNMTVTTEDREIPIRVFTPKNVSDNSPVLLWFHQGGFVIGDIDCTQSNCTHFADQVGIRVISVGYALAPENKFPAALRDAEATMDWLIQNAPSIGADADQILVGGESAGGFLAAHICQYANRGLALEGKKPICQILVYPWLQSRGNTKSYETFASAYPLNRALMDWFVATGFDKEEDRELPEASPGLAPDLAGLAPAFIHPAGFDPLTDEAEDYANRLRDAGVDVTFKRFNSLAHSFLMMTGAIPAAKAAEDEICEEMRTFLKNR